MTNYKKFQADLKLIYFLSTLQKIKIKMFPDGKFPGEDLMNSWYPILFALVIGLLFGIR